MRGTFSEDRPLKISVSSQCIQTDMLLASHHYIIDNISSVEGRVCMHAKLISEIVWARSVINFGHIIGRCGTTD